MTTINGRLLADKLAATLRHPWPASVMRLSALEDTLALLSPMLSITEVKARVVAVRNETADVKTFILQPNWLWQRQNRAGQFVRLRLEINGRRVERVYSLSSPPGSPFLAITVKRQPGGLVSSFLHERIKPGAVITLGQATGAFVLPDQLPPHILLLGAGSGVTPLWAMLQDLRQRGYAGSVVWLQVCRNRAERIFAAELAQLALNFPALRQITHFSAEQGRLDWPTLCQYLPDWQQRTTWLCGPQDWMQAIGQHWHAGQAGQDRQDGQAGVAPLYTERFSVAPLLPLAAAGSPVQVHLAATGATFVSRGEQPLLVAAERAGLQPKHGCRIGICHTCQCKKHSGTVQNLQTGEISDQPDQWIRLCISAARSDLSLDL